MQQGQGRSIVEFPAQLKIWWMMSNPYKLDEINNMDRQVFVAAFGGVFEDSLWVAETAWQSVPFASKDALIETLFDIITHAGREAQLKLLRAHPELGARKPLTGYSAGEQSRAGLQQEQDNRVTTLADLNQRYRQKFGFPFILAVKGLTPDKILENFHSRLENNPEDEFNECLAQVFQIASFRLEDLLVGETIVG